MKPKDLKSPFTWETRRPLLQDHVLYVPTHYADHSAYQLPSWSSSELFGREAPLEIEYCSGNGAWIVEKALAHKERNWIAVEVQFERVRKIWSKIKNYNLSNLLVVCGEALAFTQHYIKERCFSSLYVNFPDPWPKDKHAKNRLLKEPFFSQLARTSLPGALLTVVTDHPSYALSTIEELEMHPDWASLHTEPHYVRAIPDYGSSYFDALWREKGLSLHYIQYERHDTSR